MSNINDTVKPLKGRLNMTFRNKKTGEIIEEHGDNLVVNIGMSQILRAFTTPAPSGGSLQYVFQSFRIGSDVGLGTLLNPENAQGSTTAADQNVVYTVDYNNVNIIYPNYYSVVFKMALDGNTVMAQYPTQVDLRFSSAGLYSGDDELLAYRRFKSRTITEEIAIDITWTLYFDGQGGI